MKAPSALATTSNLMSLPPNAYKMAMSLRRVGYDPYDAIIDLIDNAFDAGSTDTNVQVTGVKRKGKNRIESIIITDNGCGMDLDTLKQALRYGSDTEHDIQSDLGMFGMGLNMASTSMGQRFEIITCNGDGYVSRGVFDFELFKNSENFEYEVSRIKVDKPTPIGTQIKITKIDSIGTNDPKSFRNTLIKRIARTFRHLLSSGKNKIVVGKREVKPHDPLYWDHPDTIKYTDGWVQVKGFKSLQYRCVSVRKVSDVEHGTRTTNQGVSWIRNGREISFNNTAPFWRSLPDYRGFLVEARYTGGEIDSDIKVNIQKRLLIDNLSQNLKDIMGSEIIPYLNQAHKQYKSEQKASNSSEISGELSSKLDRYGEKMKGVSKSLFMPAKQPKLNKATSNSEQAQDAEQKNDLKDRESSTTEEEKIKAHRSSHLGRNFRFERSAWTEWGPLLNPQMQGNDIILTLNSDHPFIQRLESSNDIGLAAVNGVLAAIGLAMLMVPQQEEAALRTFFDHFSKNCAHLVKNITSI